MPNEHTTTREPDLQAAQFPLPETLSIDNVKPLLSELKKQKKKHPDIPITIDFQQVRHFDSTAIALLNYLKRHYDDVTYSHVTPEMEQMFGMFPLSDSLTDKTRRRTATSFKQKMVMLANKYLTFKEHFKNFMVLLADEISYTAQYMVKRRGIYPGEIFNQLFFMGYKSFPIVSIISFLVGLTISITSLEQLRLFGADVYLADLVGYGMLRELVPLMTGIILAGKIGASITAEISSMKVMEETDALKTMGIVPEKFLMVPRLISITMAVPLLVAIADFVGIFAGVLVAQLLSDIPPAMFFSEMFTVVDLWDFMIGLMKTLVFGWLIVICSGYKGFNVKQGAAGVGIATTESVVLSISLIIIVDCIFAFLLY
jgi:phospholipid/cholesterol/gamma-HCH transport system permease protein